MTDAQRAVMKDLYENHRLSTWEIGREMGYLNVCVINNLRRAGVRLRNRSDANKTFEINRDYLRKIDTPTKAYLLGFFYADGNLHKDSFTIALQERDRYVLEAMGREMGYTGGLGFRKKQAPNKQNMWALRIHDKEFAETLRQVGVVARKTSKVRFPTFIDPSLKYAFLHGLSDGDGCVSCVGNRLSFALAGAKEMVLDIKSFLKEDTNLDLLFIERPNSRGTVGTLNGVNAVRFLHRMYSQSKSTIWLTRKREKFVGFLRFKRDFAITRENNVRVTPHQIYSNILKDLNETPYSFTH